MEKVKYMNMVEINTFHLCKMIGNKLSFPIFFNFRAEALLFLWFFVTKQHSDEAIKSVAIRNKMHYNFQGRKNFDFGARFCIGLTWHGELGTRAVLNDGSKACTRFTTIPQFLKRALDQKGDIFVMGVFLNNSMHKK